MEVLISGSQLSKKTTKKKTGSLKKRAWSLLSEVIRRASAKNGICECYTCGNKFPWKEIQAGHGIGGRGNSILFDESIIRPQCVGCNIFKNGNYEEFAAKLIRENGLEWYEDKLRQRRIPQKSSNTELLERIAEYEKRLEALDEA